MDGSLYRWINRLANRTGWAHGFFTAYANYGIVIFALLLLSAYLQGRQHGELRVVASPVSGSWRRMRRAPLLALGAAMPTCPS